MSFTPAPHNMHSTLASRITGLNPVGEEGATSTNHMSRKYGGKLLLNELE